MKYFLILFLSVGMTFGQKIVSPGGVGGSIAHTVIANPSLTPLKVPMSDSTGTNLVDSTLSFTSSTNAFLTGPLQGYNLHITSGTASLTANDPFSIIQTWNNAGVVYTGLLMNITNTASSVNSTLLNCVVGAGSVASINKAGHLSLAGGIDILTGNSTGTLSAIGTWIRFGGGISLNGFDDVQLSRPASGVLLLTDGSSGWNRVCFGLTTSAAPALRRNGAGLDVRLADDSNYAVIVSAGITNTGNATAGTPGEVVTSSVSAGAAVALVTATGTNVTSISLTAGDWSVEGNINFAATTATVTGTSGGITTTTLTVPNDGTEVYSGVQVTLLSENDSVTIPRKRINVSSTTTVYLVGKCTFSAGSVSAFGAITATRFR